MEQDEFGDQEAKDRIDAAESVGPSEALILLEKALAFGHTGIQASKAFLRIGLIYEDMGNRPEAIRYYTKSIEAWRHEAPEAIVLFWRGKLYLDEELLELAQTDLAMALKTGLVIPERDQAQRYLAEIALLLNRPAV